ncbi:MAG TPA: hypothetical protein PLR99_03830 [Polyangiaceae bacterium]|nr:hypothetical protein [Polyangiaceae bacterium]
MILPTKGIQPRQALVTVGADVLRLLTEAKTVSRIWDELRKARSSADAVTFDWFVLSLDLLFLMGAIEIDRGRVRRSAIPLSQQEESP